MKRHSILAFIISLSFCAANASAQNVTYEQVKSDTAYIYGEGSGSTSQEADENALADLASQISVQVSHTFTMTEDETLKDNQLNASSYVSSKVKTYTNFSLKGARKIPLPASEGKSDFHVIRFIKQSQLNTIFEGRKRLIESYVKDAEEEEAEGKVSDALRDYYWAFSLLKTYPYANELTYTDKNGSNRFLVQWLPKTIDNIFHEIEGTIVGRHGDLLDLKFTFREEPVVSLDFSYFDGSDWSDPISAKDGIAQFEIAHGATPKDLRLKIEYAYRFRSQINDEVDEVLSVVNANELNSEIKIPFKVNPKAATFTAGQNDDIYNTSSIAEMTDDAAYRQKTNAVIAAIRNGKYDTARDNFTDEGYEMYCQLISYGKAHIIGKPQYKIYSNGDDVIVRSIPMSFSFERGVRKSFKEDVVFTFNETGKIDCIAFSLDKTAVDDILAQGYWSDSVRTNILQFMENYKTAYCLKRLDYIEQIFDDDAVIIVGKVAKRLKRVGSSDKYEYASNPIITKTRYTKDEYLEKLKHCFKSNECVNIHFTNNKVRMVNDKIFEILIKQDYYSTHYGDSGYLFLMVDMHDPERPLIKVRTWQETPDPDDGLYDASDF